jgi:hypothetical protein
MAAQNNTKEIKILRQMNVGREKTNRKECT